MAHKRHATRSNDVEDVDDEDMVQNYDHPWIQFPEGSRSLKKLHLLKGRKLVKTRSICWQLLRDVGEERRARSMLTPHWEKFFNIEGPIYQDLCLEFFSTYSFDGAVQDVNYQDAITFNLGGYSWKFSIAQFGEWLGLYTKEETQHADFKNALTKLPDDITEQSFWQEIGEGIYEACNHVKATALFDPLHRYFHRVISESIGGRRVTGGGITKKDLFLLYCLIKKKPCNIAYVLADYFNHCTGRKSKYTDGHVCGGTYVTHIAKELGILIPDNLEHLFSAVPQSGVVGRDILERKSLGRVFDGVGFRFVLNDEMWVPPPQTGSDANDLALQLVEGEPSHPPRHPRRQPRHEDQGRPRRPPSHRATNQEMLQTMQEQLNATHQLFIQCSGLTNDE